MLTGIYLLLLFGFLHKPITSKRCIHKRNVVITIDSTENVTRFSYNSQFGMLNRLLVNFNDISTSALVYSNNDNCSPSDEDDVTNKVVNITGRYFIRMARKQLPYTYSSSKSKYDNICVFQLIRYLRRISGYDENTVSFLQFHVIPYQISDLFNSVPNIDIQVRIQTKVLSFRHRLNDRSQNLMSNIQDFICDPQSYNSIPTTTMKPSTKGNNVSVTTVTPSIKTNIQNTINLSTSLKTKSSSIFSSEMAPTVSQTRSILTQFDTKISEIFPTTSTVTLSTKDVKYNVTRAVIFKKEILAFTSQGITDEELANETWAEGFVNKSFDLLHHITDLEQSDDKTTDKKKDVESKLIEFVEDTCVKIGENLATGTTITKMDKELAMEISAVNPKTFSGYQFPRQQSANTITDQTMLTLPPDLMSNLSIDKVSMVALKYQPIKVMRLLNTINTAVVYSSNSFTLASTVLSVTVNAALQTPFVNPLKHSIHLTKPLKRVKRFKCVYWEPSTRSWLSDGCKLAYINESVVSCDCYHMTAFSVLMQINDFENEIEHDVALKYISYIGCSVSVASCFCLIAVFLIWRQKLLKNDRNVIHVNLAVAIALSNGLFLAADFAHTEKDICEGVSISLLYFLTATLLWMLIEGIHVYFMIVKVFRSERRKKNLYMAFGWIVPAALPAVIAIEFRSDLIRPHFCWITTTVIWLFVGPALFVILVNTVVLGLTLCKASHKHGSDTLELKRIARLTLLLLPLFGISWLLGVFALNSDGMLFQYAFTILNSLQGFFVFIGYCVCNSEVRREIFKRHINYSTTHSSKKSTMRTLDVANRSSTTF